MERAELKKKYYKLIAKIAAIFKNKMAAICRIWIFANMYKYVIWDPNNMLG